MTPDASVKINISERAFLPVYRHLLRSDADINFIWGGRDSGKSHFIAQKLLMECLSSPSFRCIMVKKTFESIKDAQWQTLKDVAADWNIDHLFDFTRSPLEIRCRVNGNSFIARGCDKPEKIKSISNPTTAWFEEANQLTRDDIIVVMTSLRSNAVSVKQWMSFNPECDGDFVDHWLWRYFEHHVPNGEMTFESFITVDLPDNAPVVLKYTSTHSTYLNNPFCSPERIAVLNDLKNIDPFYYDVFVLGIWGLRKNDNPFIFAYDPNKHDGRPVFDPSEILYLSFDFNKNPICCAVIQHFDDAVKVIRLIKLPNSDIFRLCDFIVAHYPDATIIVTGDATGKTSTALQSDNVNYYTVIMEKLNLGSSQIRVPAANPRIEKNRMLVNAVLANYPVEIHVDDARGLISDFKNVRMRPDGSIEKGDRNDPAQQADALDAFRYYCNSFMRDYVTTIE